MGLSSDLVSQFTKITNDSNGKKSDMQLRGTITKYDEKLFVQLDGSNELTPIARTVEVAEGDRVEVTIANHSATVTGNLSDPAIGVMRAGQLESKITQTAEQIRLELSNEATKFNSALTLTASEIRSEVQNGINGLDSKITQNADSISTIVQNQDEFSEFKQTVEGFSFMGAGGTVQITGGDINLTGAITFNDLNQEVKNGMDATTDLANQALNSATSANGIATDALNKANEAIGDASTALSRANSAYNYASSITIPGYLESTKITKTTIESPTIEGNEIKVYGTFQTIGLDNDGNRVSTGYMGAASGMDGDGTRTTGVALSYAWNPNTHEVSDSYVIVTNAGVRLQHGVNSVTVSDDGIYLEAPDNVIHLNTPGSGAAFYNGVEIGTGAGTVTAVWG